MKGPVAGALLTVLVVAGCTGSDAKRARCASGAPCETTTTTRAANNRQARAVCADADRLRSGETSDVDPATKTAVLELVDRTEAVYGAVARVDDGRGRVRLVHMRDYRTLANMDVAQAKSVAANIVGTFCPLTPPPS